MTGGWLISSSLWYFSLHCRISWQYYRSPLLSQNQFSQTHRYLDLKSFYLGYAFSVTYYPLFNPTTWTILLCLTTGKPAIIFLLNGSSDKHVNCWEFLFLVDADVTCLCMYRWITFTIPRCTYERWENVCIYFQFCNNSAHLSYVHLLIVCLKHCLSPRMLLNARISTLWSPRFNSETPFICYGYSRQLVASTVYSYVNRFYL